jgi:DNA polymerase-3 subunit beta
VYLVSRLIEGNFPDYEQIIPKEYQTYVTALVKDLEHSLRSVNIFANKFMQVGLAVAPDKNSITLKSENADHGRAEEVVRVDGHGAELALSFNQQYLMEALGHFAADSVELSLAGIGRPLVIKAKDSDAFRYLVMPMNK